MKITFKRQNDAVGALSYSAILFNENLFILAFSCSLRLLLALYAGLFIALAFTKLAENSASGALSLESADSAIQGFVFFNFYFCHFYPSLRSMQRDLSNRNGDIYS